MTNKFKNREDFSIPQSLINEHEWLSDSFIDSLGQVCTLIYNSIPGECLNCTFDSFTNTSTGVYKSGGPIPFENYTTCPYCFGSGLLNLATTDTIKLRLYFTNKDFLNLGLKFEVGDSVVVVIGYMVDLARLERANEIKISNTLVGRDWTCKRKGEATPWGFNKNRYFMQVLERVGGG